MELKNEKTRFEENGVQIHICVIYVVLRGRVANSRELSLDVKIFGQPRK